MKYLITLFLFFINISFGQHTTVLDANGDNNTTYTLIKSAFGEKSIEAPDLYKGNHKGFKHIQQGYDEIVGNHFIFYIHRDLDKDRNKFVKFSDRQRNEIKVYGKSKEILKAKENDSFIYKWKFKIDKDMKVSKNFTHLFQLKAVGGDDKHPILTISGVKKKNRNSKLEIRYKIDNKTILADHEWEKAKGIWLEVICKITFSKLGKLDFTIKTLDNKTLISVNKTDLPLWKNYQFIRPKWGIYRSLKNKHHLNPDVDKVRFADFSITNNTKKTNK